MVKRPLLIFLVLFLMTSVEYVGAVETQFYWLRPGAYAVYVLGPSSLEPVPGALLEEPEYYNLYIPDFYNKSAPIFTFDNVTLVWKVLSINGSYVLVNYTFVLYNIYYVKKLVGLGLIKGEFYRDRWVLVSAVLRVDLRTMYVYTVNGSFVGRWPFWINTYDLYNGFENHTYYTIVHNVLSHDPLSPNATLTHLNFTIYFVGSGEEAVYEGLNPEDYGITTPVGYFISSRIRCAYPRFINVNGTLYVSSNPGFLGYWDVVTHIMFAYQDAYYIDDVLRFFLGDPYYAAIRFNGPLVIADTNIDFKFSESSGTPSSSDNESVSNVSVSIPVVNRTVIETGVGGYRGMPWLLRIALISVCLVVVGVSIYAWERRL